MQKKLSFAENEIIVILYTWLSEKASDISDFKEWLQSVHFI